MFIPRSPCTGDDASLPASDSGEVTLTGTEGPEFVVSHALSRLARLLDRAGDPRLSTAEQARRLAQFAASFDTFFLTGGSVTATSSSMHEVSHPGALGADRRRTHRMLHELSTEQDRLLRDVLLPGAEADGMLFPDWDEVDRIDRAGLRSWFRDNAYPLITPMSVDATHPFPNLVALTLNIGVLVRDRQTSERFACVQVPPALPGYVALDRNRVVLTDAVISGMLEDVFAGMEVVERSTFRVTRVVGTTRLRAPGTPYVRPTAAERGAVVRLEVGHTASERLVGELVGGLGLDADAVFRRRAPLGLTAAMSTAMGTVTGSAPSPRTVDAVSITKPLSEVAGSG